jgi:hypothetical protein
MPRVRITLANLTVFAELNNSLTARQLVEKLPFHSVAQRWGNEVYFQTPLTAPPENPEADVPAGTVAYWPPGNALCLFFGQKPYSPVNPVGKLEGDPQRLAAIADGDPVTVELA